MTALRFLTGAVVLVATALAAMVWTTTITQAQPVGEPVAAENMRDNGGQKFTRIGTQSCTAQGCHGGLARKEDSPIFGNEYAIWLETDPHAEAYSDLFQDRSKRMAEMLNLGVPAHQSQRCLTCHSSGLPASDAVGSYSVSDGVSCEACHGAASHWVDAHTRDTWKKMTSDFQRDRHGLNPLKSLSSRAKKCAECHVGTGDRDGDGSPDRDMNHDLIAAGHPRLNFEFSAYLANYPKHWQERTWDADGRVQRSEPPTDFEARAWAVGQVAVAWAALDLLEGRALGAANNKPHAVWPELSEYSCFDCHHELHLRTNEETSERTGWRHSYYEKLSPAERARRLAQPAWGSWHLAMLPALSSALKVEPALELSSLNDLRRSMVPLGSQPTEILDQARQAAAQLAASLSAFEKAQFEPAEMGSLMATWSSDEAKPSLMNWDSAAQLYLALTALRQVRPANEALDGALADMVSALRFPPLERDGEAVLLDSPAEFNPQEAFLKALDSFHAEAAK